MKFLIPLLASTLLAQATPTTPGEAALAFLEKARTRKVSLEPGADTAISSQTADGKKRQIARRLDRMALDLGKDPLELGAVNQDGDFAAVIVRKTGSFDPARLQVFPIAMVKMNSGWTAAPVPASFENAGVGLSIQLRERLDTLENWMLRQQVDDLEKLRERSAAQMREKIETRLTVDQLRDLDVNEVGRAFLTACGQRDLPSILGLFGGLSAQLPGDWTIRLRAAEKATSAGRDAAGSWRLLMAPEVLCIPVHHEEMEDKGLFSIACLDPATSGTGPIKPVIRVLHLELTKSVDGLWQINPPRGFLSEKDDRAGNDSGESDTDLVHRFATEWSNAFPPEAQATAEEASARFIASLQEPNPASLFRIARFRSSPEAASTDCLSATRFWSPFHDLATFRHAMPLSMKTGEATAVALIQVFSSRDIDTMDTRAVYFERTPEGWLWLPLPDKETVAGFEGWVTTERKLWSDKWQARLLSGVALVDKDSQPPTEAEARECVASWLGAIRSGDFTKALSLTAKLPSSKGTVNTLRNTGYEILAARRDEQPTEIQKTYQGKSCTAVGVRATRGGKATHPLYSVVKTADGPRILVEIDLVASGNRSRDYLNRDALGQLAKALSPEASDDLKELLERYQNAISSPSPDETPAK